MKQLLFIAIIVISGYAANAQCVDTAADNCVTVHQSTLDRANKAVTELVEARKVIDAFSHERTATDAERQAYANLKTVTESAISIFQTGLADRDKVIALYQKAVETLTLLNEKLVAQLNRPKSGWQRFVAVVEKITYLLAGVALGRASGIIH